jgi:hypothetical protein
MQSNSSRSHPVRGINISVLGSPESLETVIKVLICTTGSLYDIAPTTESNHATEELPMGIDPDMDTEELNNRDTYIRFSLKITLVVTSTDVSLGNSTCSYDCGTRLLTTGIRGISTWQRNPP